jgi:hypothetical protein
VELWQFLLSAFAASFAGVWAFVWLAFKIGLVKEAPEPYAPGAKPYTIEDYMNDLW